MKQRLSILSAALATLAAGAALAHPPRAGHAGLTQFDSNGDGSVQIAEIEAGAAARAAQIDANADGRIEVAEVKAWHDARRAERARQRLLRHDADKDGSVSADEFAAAQVERVRTFDADADGVIAADEWPSRGEGRHARRGGPRITR